MKFFVCSDLHTEFLTPAEQLDLFDSFPEVEGIIIAGDLSTKKYLKNNLSYLCKKYKEVIFVVGNHEFYNSSFPEIDDLLEEIEENLIENLSFLDNSVYTYNDIKFLGGTLWFKDEPLNILYEKQMNDFSYIKNLRHEVYDKNRKTVEILENLIDRDSIIITHHLPSFRSVNDKYKGYQSNRFFVCDMEKLILKKQPKLWIHGHTHDSCDYMIGSTRILCNPLSYPQERNKKFDNNLIIEI